MAVFHYTTNDARVMRCSGRWQLSVGYCQCPDHNQSKRTRADSRAKKFMMPDLPTLFDSEEDALAMGVEFRAQHVLGNCEDFREEIGAMQELVQSHDNIVQFSPKGHPDIAGAGIEFDWGVSKKYLRYKNNHIAKNCENDVRSLLAKVTLQIAKNTARKARSYM